MTELTGYSPLGAEAHTRIAVLWENYRNTIGLEGAKSFNWRKVRQFDEDEIQDRLMEHREQRSAKLGDWKRECRELS